MTHLRWEYMQERRRPPVSGEEPQAPEIVRELDSEGNAPPALVENLFHHHGNALP
jgi:hypothetical protein